MSIRLRITSITFGLVACLLAAALVRELTGRTPAPPAARPARRATGPGRARPASTAPASASAYGVVATKNLFSPSRSEIPAGPVVAAGPRPVLHGVVMDGPQEPRVPRGSGGEAHLRLRGR